MALNLILFCIGAMESSIESETELSRIKSATKKLIEIIESKHGYSVESSLMYNCYIQTDQEKLYF